MQAVPERRWLVVIAAILLMLSACASEAAPAASSPAVQGGGQGGAPENAVAGLSPVALAEGERLRVVATTSIVADVVRQVGGEQIELTTLMPPGTDPHGYSATPQDLRTMGDAHVIFINGLGLEESLLPVLENRDGNAALIAVNAGIEPMEAEGEHGLDPHTWFAVRSVESWTETIAQALASLDPANGEAYAANAAAYRDTLEALDGEIRAAVASLPDDRRKLVTDHDEFGYFAAEYGFTVVGSVIPTLSTQASPSAQELARLQEQILREGVKAIFTGNAANPRLEEQIAADTGIQVVRLYTASLSEAGGPAPTYVEMMRYNVDAIVEALR